MNGCSGLTVGVMDTLTKKTIQTSRGFKYTYYVSPASPGKPTIFLLHGWPDSAALWEDLATKHLEPAGFGAIVPDCLGYAGTDKPTDPHAYSPLGLTNDFREILDAEQVQKVISSGHDWGAGLAHRFYTFHPDRCIGLITLNVAIRPKPERVIELDLLEPVMAKAIGYFPQAYWYLFTDPIAGPELMARHTDSLFTALHAEPAAWMHTFCAKDGMKNWLEQDRKGPVQPYATDSMRTDFIARMSGDGFAAPLCYYRALVEGVFYEGEKHLPADRYVVNVPYLFVAGMLDAVCRPQEIEQSKQAGLTPKLTVEELDVGHWSMLAKPKEVGEAIVKWLENNY